MRLITIDGVNNYFTVYTTDLETREMESVLIVTGYSNLFKRISKEIKKEDKVIFNNEDVVISNYLTNNFKENLVFVKSEVFNRRTYGIFPSQNIRSYGFNLDIVESLKVTSNMEKYFIIKETLTPACHASTIYKKKNGEILTAWFGGSREGADDVGIFLSRKSEGADFQIAEKMAGGKEPHWNPVLFSTNDQKVFLFYNHI